jgi:carbon-monoxide dehydrogenase small subunit
MTISIHASVNGEPCQFQCQTTDTLLKVLRENLQMTGTKQGCGTGDCGACSVIMNGELVCACLVLAVECGQADILTVEGLASAGQLHPLQQAFLENAALQCGICTPGLLMAAKALLDKHPQPDETQVRYWIAGNLCRCTGYDKIVRAIMGCVS